MEFYLKYEGPLKANANSKDKQSIREYLYPQMKNLWNMAPLNSRRDRFLDRDHAPSVLRQIDGVVFAPLVSTALNAFCELDITIL